MSAFDAYRSYLDLRWSPEGNGPKFYNCYNFVRKIFEEQFGKLLPEVTTSARDLRNVIKGFRAPEAVTWCEPVETPQHGDAVIFTHKIEPMHIGVWLEFDRGVVIHCAERLNVTVCDLETMRRNEFIAPKFYRVGPR